MFCHIPGWHSMPSGRATSRGRHRGRSVCRKRFRLTGHSRSPRCTRWQSGKRRLNLLTSDETRQETVKFQPFTFGRCPRSRDHASREPSNYTCLQATLTRPEPPSLRDFTWSPHHSKKEPSNRLETKESSESDTYLRLPSHGTARAPDHKNNKQETVQIRHMRATLCKLWQSRVRGV